MQPFLFRIGSVYVHTYGVVLVAGFAVAVWLAARAARDGSPGLLPLSASEAVEVGSMILVGGVVGARAFYVIQHWEVFLRHPLEIPAIWHGGLVWYGGVAGASLAGWGYGRLKRMAFLRGADQMVPFIALAYGIGRIGCFLNGCCYGRPTAGWFGVVFPYDPSAVARVPTQLLEAASGLAFYAALRLLQAPRLLDRPGTLFGLYLVGYAATRFAIEFLRGDQILVLGGWTIPQLVSLPVGLLGASLLVRARPAAGRSRG